MTVFESVQLLIGCPTDPLADQTAHIAVGIEEEYGMPSKDMQPFGVDHRFTVEWPNKTHNALGSYLHEPTISQHKSGKADRSA